MSGVYGDSGSASIKFRVGPDDRAKGRLQHTCRGDEGFRVEGLGFEV